MFPKQTLTKKEFWSVYLHALNAYNRGSYLTDKEIHIFATILDLLDKEEVSIKYFSKPHTEIISSILKNSSYAEIHRVKEGLLKKGLINVGKDTEDARRRNYKLCMSLSNLKNYIDTTDKLELSINIPIILKEKDE